MTSFKKCDSFMNKCYNFEKITNLQVAETESQLKESLVGNRRFTYQEAVKLGCQISSSV
jgi:hypothetical protein